MIPCKSRLSGRLDALGFTLIELLVVVLIIGILAAVALPQYQKAVEKTKAVQVYTLLSSLYHAQKAYYLSTGQWAKDFSELSIDFPYQDPGADVYRFVGGDFVWNKCSNYSCAYAAKKYKDGVWALEIMFAPLDHQGQQLKEGEIICMADDTKNGYGMCQSLGFSKTSYYTHPGLHFGGVGGLNTIQLRYYRKD